MSVQCIYKMTIPTILLIPSRFLTQTRAQNFTSIAHVVQNHKFRTCSCWTAAKSFIQNIQSRPIAKLVQRGSSYARLEWPKFAGQRAEYQGQRIEEGWDFGAGSKSSPPTRQSGEAQYVHPVEFRVESRQLTTQHWWPLMTLQRC